MTARRRIAILMHEKDGEHTIHQYVITLLADHWREDGHEVFFLFGTKRFVPADLIIVHVDLSVVPDSYLRFAARYPVAVNGRVRDIRKSTFSTGLLRPDDLWQGPVIVKSDFNYAGEPERLREEPRVQSPLRRLWTSVRADRQRPPTEAFFETSGDYRVYDRLSEVPAAFFDDSRLVVQKFFAERDSDGLYCVRIMNFLGDRISCMRLKGRKPIVNGPSTEAVESVEPHAEILEARKRLNFEFGKFDYVVVDGKAILLDINKTVGCAANLLDNEEMRELRRHRAAALYDFFR